VVVDRRPEPHVVQALRDPDGLVGPYGIAFDPDHNLWVADAYGNRVLGYKAPFGTGEAASMGSVSRASLVSLLP
jgi:sugar lactone lactonase YvrE